jgi:hypothetical protein
MNKHYRINSEQGGYAKLYLPSSERVNAIHLGHILSNNKSMFSPTLHFIKSNGGKKCMFLQLQLLTLPERRMPVTKLALLFCYKNLNIWAYLTSSNMEEPPILQLSSISSSWSLDAFMTFMPEKNSSQR